MEKENRYIRIRIIMMECGQRIADMVMEKVGMLKICYDKREIGIKIIGMENS
jgi:hypothetical protein